MTHPPHRRKPPVQPRCSGKGSKEDAMLGAMGRGATWMVLLRLLDRLVGVLSVLVLARLLVPADFGLVAMAMSVIAVIELAGAFSFEAAIIQRPVPTREHYDTTWTLNVIFGAACALATAALAKSAASFYSEPRLVPVMLVLAAGWLMQSLENVGTVNFRRDMDFGREFRFLLAKRLTGFVVTLSLAFAFRSYWALVIGSTAARATGVVLSYTMQAYRPRFSLAARHDLMAFSIWIFVNNLLGFFSTRGAHFIVGRIHGPQALGLFTVGSELATLPSTDLVAPITRAVFPGFSRMAETAAGLREGFAQVLAVVALIAVPACAGLAVLAEPLILTLLGPKWIAAVPVVQILALAGVVQVLTANNYYAYLALGKTHIPVILGAISVLVLLPGLFLMGSWGLRGIALAQLGASLATAAPSMYLLAKNLGISASRIAGAIWRPVLASTLMAAALLFFASRHGSWLQGLAPPLQLLLQVLLGTLAYGTAVLVLWLGAGRPAGAESKLIDIASPFVRRAASWLGCAPDRSPTTGPRQESPPDEPAPAVGREAS